MDQISNPKPYASGRLRALMTIILLALGAAVGVLSMIVNAAMVATLRGAGGLGEPYELGESASELLYVGVALLQLVIFFATVLAFVMWMHRVYRNLHALGAARPDTTPGWAVAYFFIPIVNLFKPFEVMREIWHKSTPGDEADGGFDGLPARSGTPALIGWWWAFWLISNITGRVSDRAVNTARTIEGMLLAFWVTIASDALFVIAAVLAILVVKRIDEMQEARFRGMGAQGPPPPPESFETLRTA